MSFKEWEEQQEFYDYKEWLIFKYRFNLDNVLEEHSFDNWKLNGKPKAGF
jgi:hypothetical protein